MQDEHPVTSGDRASKRPARILADDAGAWQPSPPPTHTGSYEHRPDETQPLSQSETSFEGNEVTPAQRQRIIPEGEDVETAPTHMSTLIDAPYPVRQAKNPNQRRSQHLLKFMALVYGSILLLIGAFALWFYSLMTRQLDARLGGGGQMQTASHLPKSATPGATSQDAQNLSGSVQKQLADMQAQLTATQTRLAEAEQQNKTTSARLKDILENPLQTSRSAEASSSASLVNSAAALGADAALPISQPDLILLKERNRLTGYADEAIATGAREPYDRLWAALDDPRLANLVHAARTEILRVQNYYLSGSRIERFDIPVGDYYPDNATLRDAQLPDDKLINLLSKGSNPWQVRLKAANLLGMRRSTAVGDALVKAIKEDKNLDVVKEATFSFEQMTGYRARLFEPTSVDAWWKQYNATPSPSKPPVKKTPSPQAETSDDKKGTKSKGEK